MVAKASCFETRCVMQVSTQSKKIIRFFFRQLKKVFKKSFFNFLDGFTDLNDESIQDLRQACEIYDRAEMDDPWDESPDFDFSE